MLDHLLQSKPANVGSFPCSPPSFLGSSFSSSLPPSSSTSSSFLLFFHFFQPQQDSTTYETVYESILEYLTERYDPSEFLSLLPSNGNMSFFLPYIKKCFLRFKARGIKHSIITALGDAS
jgi:hypothetical protein